MFVLVCMVLQIVCILPCDTSDVPVCTGLSNLSNHVTSGFRLVGFNFTTISADGVMSCAQQCLNRARCKSFNYNTNQALCDLNEADLIPVSLVKQTGFFHSNISDFPKVLSRACTHHNCSLNERCETDDEERYRCVTEFPSSCADVRKCSPGSGDGEYWIYLTNTNMVRVPIYCHSMSSNPSEYVTLTQANHGVFPRRSNEYCSEETAELLGSCNGNWGDVWFHRIRLDIKTLEVVQDDYTFANYTNKPHIYGVAQDCYSRHEDQQRSACGPVGTFKLDLRGTSFAVASEVKWEATGYKAYASVDQSSDNRQVDMLCGGYPGYCEPYPSLRLVPNIVNDTLPDVTEVVCDL